MRMVRTAIVHLDTKAEMLELSSVYFNDIEVRPLIGFRDVRGAGTLIAAESSLKYLPKMTNGMIVPETKVRNFLEGLIEHYANIISVNFSCGRNVMSPSPCLAFVPETSEDKEFLINSIGIFYPKARNPSISTEFKTPVLQMLGSLQDRLDGVALLSELISAKQPSMKFKESIRIFERAFSVSGYRLIDKLHICLKDHPGKFSKDELKKWISYRDSMSHADKQNVFVFDKDLIDPSKRAEAAAYYIAFNKEKWRSDDCSMRSIWQPTSGSRGENGGLFITAGEGSNLAHQIFDDFGVFLLDLIGGHEKNYPSDWWTWKFSGSRGTGPVTALPPLAGT